MFKHALIQDAAYASLLRSTRQQVHQQWRSSWRHASPRPSRPSPSWWPSTTPRRAVPSRRCPTGSGRATGQRPLGLSGSHQPLTTGIELLKTLPETPEHTQHALSLHIALGAALQMAKGLAAPEVEHAYTRHGVVSAGGRDQQLAPVLFGLWRFYNVRSQLHTAREAKRCCAWRNADDPRLRSSPHMPSGDVVLLGAFGCPPAPGGVRAYTPDQPRGVPHGPRSGWLLSHAAWTLWLLGYPEQALAHLHDALALAHELSHPYSLAWARCVAAFVSQFRRDVQAVHEQAEAAVALSTEQGFPLGWAWGTSAWVGAGHAGPGRGGMAQIRQGIAAYRPPGQRCSSHTFALLAGRL